MTHGTLETRIMARACASSLLWRDQIVTASDDTSSNDERETSAHELIAGIRQEAVHAADLLCDVLKASTAGGSSPPVPISLSTALACAAALRREEWRTRGLAAYLPISSENHPLDDARCARFCQRWQSLSPAATRHFLRYASRTLLIWCEHLAWCGRELLDADIVLSGPNDSEDQLDEVVEFLWTYARSRTQDASTDK